MPRTYSLDVRVHTVAAGETCRKAAHMNQFRAACVLRRSQLRCIFVGMSG
jgi:hypothetical protein